MADQTDLLDPLLDAREVVETYVHAGRELTGWEETLQASADRLAEIGSRGTSATASELSNGLGRLVEVGLAFNPSLVEDLSQRVEAALAAITVPGLPGPSDKDWSF